MRETRRGTGHIMSTLQIAHAALGIGASLGVAYLLLLTTFVAIDLLDRGRRA